MNLGFLASGRGSNMQAVMDACKSGRLAAEPRVVISNIHPALLPKFGGKGMYGSHVHAAVLAAGEKETGVTIHLADAEYDTGPIVAQCRVQVPADGTVESLARRVLEQEHRFLVETIGKIVSGEITLDNASTC